MEKAGLVRGITMALGLMLLAGVARADIASFNAAVKAGDFKAAAAEAVATWPTLNKSREDLPLIAREFGFAALMAEDFPAARMFATEAMRESGEGADAENARVLSAVLLRVAEFRAKPNDATRAMLMSALKVRDAMPAFDGISFLAVQALTKYDFGSLNWKDALESSAVAVRIATAGGAAYRPSLLRFEMMHAASSYAVAGAPEDAAKLTALAERAKTDINLAASDEAAQPFVSVYHETSVWADAADKGAPRPPKSAPPGLDMSSRFGRLMAQGANLNEGCKAKLDIDNYPILSKFKGDDRYVAMLKYVMDFDDAGRPINIRVLAAMPNAATGESIRDKYVKRWKLIHTEAGATCSLARKDYVVMLSVPLLPS